MSTFAEELDRLRKMREPDDQAASTGPLGLTIPTWPDESNAPPATDPADLQRKLIQYQLAHGQQPDSVKETFRAGKRAQAIANRSVLDDIQKQIAEQEASLKANPPEPEGRYGEGEPSYGELQLQDLYEKLREAKGQAPETLPAVLGEAIQQKAAEAAAPVGTVLGGAKKYLVQKPAEAFFGTGVPRALTPEERAASPLSEDELNRLEAEKSERRANLAREGTLPERLATGAEQAATLAMATAGGPFTAALTGAYMALPPVDPNEPMPDSTSGVIGRLLRDPNVTLPIVGGIEHAAMGRPVATEVPGTRAGLTPAEIADNMARESPANRVPAEAEPGTNALGLANEAVKRTEAQEASRQAQFADAYLNQRVGEFQPPAVPFEQQVEQGAAPLAIREAVRKAEAAAKVATPPVEMPAPVDALAEAQRAAAEAQAAQAPVDALKAAQGIAPEPPKPEPPKPLMGQAGGIELKPATAPAPAAAPAPAPPTSQRGAAFVPGLSDIGAAAKRAYETPLPTEGLSKVANKVAGAVRTNPLLKEYAGFEPHSTMDIEWRATERKLHSLGGKWENEVSQVMAPIKTPFREKLAHPIETMGADRKTAEVLGDYIVAKDQLRRSTPLLDEEGNIFSPGQVQDRTPEAMRAAISQAERTVKPEVLREVERRYKEKDRAIGQKLVEMKKVSPEALEDEHVRHFVLAFENTGSVVGTLRGGGARDITPGSANKSVGSALKIEHDPFRALYRAGVEVDRAKALWDFKEKTVATHGRNGSVREALGIVADERGHPTSPVDLESVESSLGGKSLYSFGPGKSELVANPREAAHIVRDALNGNGAALPNEPFVVNGRAWYAFDDKLAEGLAKAGEPFKRGVIGRAASAVTKPIRWLSWIARPASLMMQALSDPITVHAFPVWRWPQLWADLTKKAYVLSREWAKEHRGEASAMLDQMREEGLLQANPFQHGEDTGKGTVPGHVAPEDVLPYRFRSPVEKAKSAVKGAVFGPAEAYNKWREAWLVSTAADLYEKMGAPRRMAVESAIKRMGNFPHRSELGKQTAPATWFTKFVTEQALNLTLHAARDPITGKSNLRGVLSNPYPMIAATSLVAWALNHRDPEVAKFYDSTDNIPEATKRGLVIITRKKPDGTYGYLKIDSMKEIILGMYAIASEAAKGNFGDVGQSVAQFAGSHVSPAVSTPYEAMTGRTLEGRQIVPDEEKYYSDRESREANAKRGGGIPAPFGERLFGLPGGRIPLTRAGQHFYERLGGAPAQMTRVLNESGTQPENIVRALGWPEYSVAPGDALRQEALKNKDAKIRDFLDAVWRGNRGEDTSKQQADLIGWFEKHGIKKSEIMAASTQKTNAQAKQEAMTPTERREYEKAKRGLPHAEVSH